MVKVPLADVEPRPTQVAIAIGFGPNTPLFAVFVDSATSLLHDAFSWTPSRRRATVQTAWPRSLRFLASSLANEAFRVDGENVAMLAAGAARDERQVERVSLRIQANPVPPHGAAADFDLVRMVNGGEMSRERWTLSLQFMFLDAVEPELMIVNPMGIIITYMRGDRALVSG